MRKLVYFVVLLVMVTALVGCQQSQLSEEEIRNIIKDEVTRQLGSVDNAVKQEVTRQLADIDTLTLSGLYIKDAQGKRLIHLGAAIDGGGRIVVFNSDEEGVARLVSNTGGRGTLILAADGDKAAIELGSSVGNEGYLFISSYTPGGQMLLGRLGDAQGLYINNRYGETVVLVGSDSESHGYLLLRDKFGQYAFGAP